MGLAGSPRRSGSRIISDIRRSRPAISQRRRQIVMAHRSMLGLCLGKDSLGTPWFFGILIMMVCTDLFQSAASLAIGNQG